MSETDILSEMSRYLSANSLGHLSLPSRAYVDESFFALERSRIFERSWFCVARADELANEGDYVALSLVGEPIIVVNGEDGVLRAMSNICRHRLYPLVSEGHGHTKRFTCNYHKWFYGLDGQLGAAPHMERTLGFDRSGCFLPEFGVETWLGFVFVNLDRRAAPFRERLEQVTACFANYEIGDATTMATYHKLWHGNWKLGVENASECYHHVGLHKNTVEPLVPTAGAQVMTVTDDWTYQYAPVRVEQPTESPYRGGSGRLSEEDRTQLRIFNIFPAFVILTVGTLIQGLSFIPRTVGSVDVRVWSLLPRFVSDEIEDIDAAKARIQIETDAVNSEDELGTAMLQPNASSAFATRGWLSKKEDALVGFYAYLARALRS